MISVCGKTDAARNEDHEKGFILVYKNSVRCRIE